MRVPYRVTGYDDRGECLFSIVVEAVSNANAQFAAFVQLRGRPDGTALANRATRVETKRDI
jgi:hypothetical protein